MINRSEYMKITKCSLFQAIIAIKYFEFIDKKLNELECPECGNLLEVEYGSYEEGYDDFVMCDECDFTDNFDEKYKYLSSWHGFDPVLYDSEMFGDLDRKQILYELTIERLKEMEVL